MPMPILNGSIMSGTALPDAAVIVLPFIEKEIRGISLQNNIAFIHEGDGGSGIPASTLIVGPSISTAFHEWMHS